MSSKKPTYKELQERLIQAEETIEAVRSGRIDAILGEDSPLIVKSKSLEEETQKLKTAIEQTSDWETLIKNAETALTKAKSIRLNNYQFFEEQINVRTSEFIHMQRHLFHALEKDEFIMYYQPYFDCQTKVITGMEALIRWNSPKFGLVLPNMFIPFLEETGMIIDVGKEI